MSDNRREYLYHEHSLAMLNGDLSDLTDSPDAPGYLLLLIPTNSKEPISISVNGEELYGLDTRGDATSTTVKREIQAALDRRLTHANLQQIRFVAGGNHEETQKKTGE